MGFENVEGNDVAGYVEAIGDGVTKFKKGDRVCSVVPHSSAKPGAYPSSCHDKVAAFTKMFTDAKYGAYAEFSVSVFRARLPEFIARSSDQIVPHQVSPSNTAFHLPSQASFEEAAALPLAYITAVIGLHLRLGLPEPGVALPRDAATILVYGAATTVGVYVTQLAKKAGHRVVGIAGGSIDLALSYGADDVIDYRGKTPEQLADEISQAAGGEIHYVYDAVAEHGSFEASVAALKKNGGGRYTHVLPISDEQAKSLPEGVTAHAEMCNVAYQGPEEEQKHCEKYFDLLGEWLAKGEFRTQRLEIVPGGLGGVEEGLRRLQQNEVKGQKLVYRIAETPGLKA